MNSAWLIWNVSLRLWCALWWQNTLSKVAIVKLPIQETHLCTATAHPHADDTTGAVLGTSHSPHSGLSAPSRSRCVNIISALPVGKLRLAGVRVGTGVWVTCPQSHSSWVTWQGITSRHSSTIIRVFVSTCLCLEMAQDRSPGFAT